MAARGRRSDAVGMNRLVEILDLLLAEIGHGDRQSRTDLVVHRRRDPDRIRLGERFQTRGDIDAVAQQIVTVDDHIAEMDADAEPHRSSFGIPRCVRSDRILYCYCALHGGDCAGEIRHHAVAGGMKDAAAMLRDQRVDDAASRLQPRNRADLVERHQPAVADDIGGKNRRELAFDRLDRHGPASSPTGSIA